MQLRQFIRLLSYLEDLTDSETIYSNRKNCCTPVRHPISVLMNVVVIYFQNWVEW